MPSEKWGRIEVDGVSAGYGGKPEAHVYGNGEKHGQSLALNIIKVSIASGEKVGVCGQTGSGKASLLLLFLGLLEPLNPTNHSVSIDSLPLRLINRPMLRSRLIAVPQTPFLLPDGHSFRENLDPYDGAEEAECEDVLS